MNRERQRIKTPIRRHVRQIVLLLLGVSVAMAALAYLQSHTLSAVRAYVHGESLWAKAQKDAVLYLYAYLKTPTDEAYRAFEQALQVNLSYRRARLAMEQSPPDRELARQGFLAAGSHPDDVGNMMRLYLWFGRAPYMKQAIAIWAEGDGRIEELRVLATLVRTTAPTLPAELRQHYLGRLDRLHHELNNLELAFSAELGEGARWVSRTVVYTNFALLALLLLLAGLNIRRVMADILFAESALRDSETRFRTLHDSNLIGIIGWGVNGELTAANDTFLTLLGYSRADLEQGRLNWMQMTPAEQLHQDEHALRQVAERGYCDPFQKEFLHRDGHPVAVYVGGALMDGETGEGIAFVLDRSKEQQLENQMRLSATVLDASLDGIVICDQQRQILTVNDAYCAMTGHARTDLAGSILALYVAEDRDTAQQIEAALLQDDRWQGDSLIPRQEGKPLPVRISISAVKNAAGQISHYVAVFTDISVRQAMERTLARRAHHDPLTGLANRSLLSDRLEKALERAQRSRKSVALLFVDLDKFKPVNDSLGHDVGDQVLRRVAQRLQSAVRESDTLARLGGDEFMVVVEALDGTESVTRIADSMVDLLSQPITVDSHKVQLGCSIGISFYPQHGTNMIDLMRAADSAMYRAKQSTGQRWCIFADDDAALSN